MDSLYAFPGHLIRRLQQIAVSLFATRMAEAGLDLTPVQFAALTTLRDNPDLDQATLAGLIAYDRVTIGGVIERLVQKGFVQREVSTRDRRARVLRLTSEGLSILDRAAPCVAQIQSDIIAPLPEDERDIFLRLLTTLTEASNERSRAPLRDMRPRQENAQD